MRGLLLTILFWAGGLLVSAGLTSCAFKTPQPPVTGDEFWRDVIDHQQPLPPQKGTTP